MPALPTPTRTRPLAKGAVKIVEAREVSDLLGGGHLLAIGVEATGRTIRLTNYRTGDLLPPDHMQAISGKAVEHVAIHHLVGDEEAGVQIRRQVERFGARVVVVSAGAVRAWVEEHEPSVGRDDARHAYEVEATRVGLGALCGFDEFQAEFAKKAKATAADPLADLEARLKQQIAEPTGAAVLIIDVSGREGSHAGGTIEEGEIRGVALGDNDYFTTGQDPNATSLLEARARTAPVGTRGDRTPVGRVDDPALQMKDPERWGTAEQIEAAEGPSFEAAMKSHMARQHPFAPPTRAEYDSEEAQAAEAAAQLVAPGTSFPVGEVTDVSPAELAAFEHESQRYGSRTTKIARLHSQGNLLAWEHGNQFSRWTPDTEMRVPIVEQATKWAEDLVRAATEQIVGRPQLLIVQTRDGILDLDRLKVHVPVLREVTS